MNPRRAAGLPRDRRIPLATLLDEGAMAAVFAAAATAGGDAVDRCRVEHVRYRPGEDCTVLYEVESRSGGTAPHRTWVHLRSGVDSAAPASGGADGPRIRGSLLAGPLPLPSLAAVAHEFPDDPRLPAIRAVADRDTLLRALAEVLATEAAAERTFKGFGRHLRPIRYKPGSRLVIRCRTRWRDRATGAKTSERCLLRFERGDGGGGAAAVARRLQELGGSGEAFAVPTTLFHAPDLGCSGTRWIEGEKLGRALRRPGTRSRDLAATARALGALHASALAGLPARSAEDVLQAAADRQRRLSAYPGEVRDPLARLLERLQRLAGASEAGPRGTVHGDFHQGQVLLAEHRPYLLDLDRVHHAEVAADLGSFLAQLTVLELRGGLDQAAAAGDAFVTAYERVAGERLDPRRVALWTGLALHALALKELRRLKPDWSAQATAIAGRGLEIVAGGGA